MANEVKLVRQGNMTGMWMNTKCGVDNDYPVMSSGLKVAPVAKAAGTAPTKAEFDALIDALTDAGLMRQ